MKKLMSWLPWSGLALYALAGLAFWVRPGWRPEWDSAIYLLLGRSLALGEGYTYLGQPFFLRPFGLFWALLGLVQPGGYDHELLNRLLFLAAVAVLAATLMVLRPRCWPNTSGNRLPSLRVAPISISFPNTRSPNA